MTDDKIIIDKILAGDTRVFQSLIESHQRLVSHIVVRMITNRADVEDVCQEIFMKVYQYLGNFNFESKLSTWIAKIAYNTVINYLKKKKLPLYDDRVLDDKTLENYPSRNHTPEAHTTNRDMASRLQEEIAKLPAQFRAILTFYHLNEMSYREIVEVMGLPEGTVKSYLFRARKVLKENLIAKYQQEELWH
ncbi:MAG: RNA polymerase sigma factor [bacterium]